MKKYYSLLSLITFLFLFNSNSIFSQATVKTVSSFDANGTYKIGDNIDIVFWFSEAITVSGTPRLELETGDTDAFANYSSGSGSSFLTFTYTVSEGESSSDLAYTGTNALANNGGSSMLDGSGNPATLTLPAVGASGSLSYSQNFVIDGIKPTMTITASEGSDGFSSNDSTLSLTFTSSESTTGFAAADISVSNGAISSFSGSGTTYTATFTPTAEGATTIDVAQSTYKDSAGNNNSAATQFNWTYDDTAPTNQNDVFPSAASETVGGSVTIVSSGTASNQVWIAPAGTTSFSASSTMTQATSGTATSMTAPSTAGT